MRIGKVFISVARLPFESTTWRAMMIPSILTKLSGSERTTAAVSLSTSFDSNPAISMSVGPYCKVMTMPLSC